MVGRGRVVRNRWRDVARNGARAAIALLGMMVLINTPAKAQSTPCTRQAPYRQLANALESAWNAGDAEEWSALYAPDADFVNISGLLLEGRDEIKKRHLTLFAGLYKGSQLTLRIRRVVPLGSDDALLETFAELRARRSGQWAPKSTLFTFVLARDSACAWEIGFSQNTLISNGALNGK